MNLQPTDLTSLSHITSINALRDNARQTLPPGQIRNNHEKLLPFVLHAHTPDLDLAKVVYLRAKRERERFRTTPKVARAAETTLKEYRAPNPDVRISIVYPGGRESIKQLRSGTLGTVKVTVIEDPSSLWRFAREAAFPNFDVPALLTASVEARHLRLNSRGEIHLVSSGVNLLKDVKVTEDDLSEFGKRERTLNPFAPDAAIFAQFELEQTYTPTQLDVLKRIWTSFTGHRPPSQ